MRICHLDIKPKNIMISHKNTKRIYQVAGFWNIENLTRK